MGGRYIFDLETDGLREDLSKIHCIGLHNIDTHSYTHFGPNEYNEATGILSEADVIIGHNIIGFDVPAIQKVVPGWSTRAVIRDTLVMTRLIWPHVKDKDFDRAKAGKLPKKLIGRHSLEAWGYRLGNYKGDFKGPWDTYTPEMAEYMDQDVAVTLDLWQRIEKHLEAWGVDPYDPSPSPRKDCVELEHRVAEIVEKVQRHGWAFDVPKAAALVGALTEEKQKLEEKLQKAFPPQTVTETFTPKVNNRKLGYVKGEPFEKKWEVHFNPASRQQIGARLKELGWKPTEFTPNGQPKVDEAVLSTLDYPEAKLLSEYLMIDKRLGQVSNGKEGWLRKQQDGRIHGRIMAGGAHTGRMTHSNPNIAQVPANDKPFGKQCRELFKADEGYTFVGCDADGLELRDLAGYMAQWDGGDYVKTVLEGDKAHGTDMHSINARAIGCDRDTAKVFFYAMIYGAGDRKLGEIVGNPNQGTAAKKRLMKGVPALGALIKTVQRRIDTRGYIVGLDGRRLHARSTNAALNTLLQSAGAIQMKRALVILYDTLTNLGWRFGEEYSIVGLIHDEWQANVKPNLETAYRAVAEESIREAGRYYSFKCPLDAQSKAGANWSETH
jgi:DNA polymerase-1